MKLSEKNKQRIAAILFTLFFLIVYQCSGQKRIHRYPSYPEIVTLTPDKPMKFDGGNNDTIYLSILADSLDEYDYQYTLYCQFPRSVNNFSIEIQYTNNTTQIFEPYRIVDNYVELKINDGKLAYLPLSAVIFYNNNVMQSCIRIKTKDYFINFLKQVR